MTEYRRGRQTHQGIIELFLLRVRTDRQLQNEFANIREELLLARFLLFVELTATDLLLENLVGLDRLARTSDSRVTVEPLGIRHRMDHQYLHRRTTGEDGL